MVGVTRFEHATSSSRTKRSTKLSHTPLITKDKIAQKKKEFHPFFKKVFSRPSKYNHKTVDKPEIDEYNVSVRQDKYRY